jgi:hypothetical protein
MTSRQYLKHLCDNEAGEFIYKTVENVEGIRLLRPRSDAAVSRKQQHLYAMEDPYGHTEEEAEQPGPGYMFVGELLYSFIEMPATAHKIPQPSMHKHSHPSLLSPIEPGFPVVRYCVFQPIADGVSG